MSRQNAIDLAKAAAVAHGKKSKLPAYLPRTGAEIAAFEVHEWVIDAVLEARKLGFRDGTDIGTEIANKLRKRK